jgi:hypothetical protein
MSILVGIGGSNVNENTYRVMKAIMHDSVAEKLSFAGQTGKICFSSLRVKQCVCGK